MFEDSLFRQDIHWACVYYPRDVRGDDQNKLEAVEAEAKQLREAAKEHAEKLEATGGETKSLRDQVCALVDGFIPWVLNSRLRRALLCVTSMLAFLPFVF